MEAKNTTTTSSPTEAPQQALTPDQVIDQLRVIRAAIPVVAPLTSKERRRAMYTILKATPDILQAQIAVLGASDTVNSAVGVSYADAQQMTVEDAHWSTVEAEVQTLLNAVSGGNLIRRQKLHLIGAQAYGVGAWLARSAEHADLKTHVERIRRLKRVARGKKPSPETPAPHAPAPASSHQSSGT